jgi:hypothetical protein
MRTALAAEGAASGKGACAAVAAASTLAMILRWFFFFEKALKDSGQDS